MSSELRSFLRAAKEASQVLAGVSLAVPVTCARFMFLLLGDEQISGRFWTYRKQDELQQGWCQGKAEEVGPALVRPEKVLYAENL